MDNAPPAPPRNLYPLFNVRGDPALLRPLVKAVTRPGERQCDALARILRDEARRLGVEAMAS